MATEALWSVQIFPKDRRVLQRNKDRITLNEVRDNGNFRALKLYIMRYQLRPCKVNFYYRGAFVKQERYE